MKEVLVVKNKITNEITRSVRRSGTTEVVAHRKRKGWRRLLPEVSAHQRDGGSYLENERGFFTAVEPISNPG